LAQTNVTPPLLLIAVNWSMDMMLLSRVAVESGVTSALSLRGTMLETLRKGCRRLRLSRLLNLDEEVEQLAVLGVDDFAVTCYVTAKHFLVSFGTRFHRFSFLKRGHVLTDSPPRMENLSFSPL